MSETKVILPDSADIAWHDGGKAMTAESFAEELVSLRTRLAEHEANARAYEEIIGKRTYNEVAEHIRGLEEALQSIMDAAVEGRVCDDVAWFDSITTLYDFCDIALSHAGPRK